jgi:hypothetical protein
MPMLKKLTRGVSYEQARQDFLHEYDDRFE